jgi:hypothetical protein
MVFGDESAQRTIESSHRTVGVEIRAGCLRIEIWQLTAQRAVPAFQNVILLTATFGGNKVKIRLAMWS